jgi:uncharacterized protein YbjT (DUF2867 family)
MERPRRIAVFGGSGKTGRELIAAALRKGFSVRGLYRPGSEPEETVAGLEVITGQLTVREDVRRTLEGTEGAVVVFGPRLGRGHHPEPFCGEATASVIAEMKRLGLGRLVCQTGAMAGGDTPNWTPAVRRFVRRYRRQYPAVDADRDAQEAVVRGSGLDWTLVKPFRIAGGRAKGKVRVSPAVRIGAFTSIRRKDLAEFLVDELDQRRFLGQAVYIVS